MENETKRKQDAASQQRRRDKMHAKGLKQVTVWVPSRKVTSLRSYATRLCARMDPEPTISDRQFAWAEAIANRIGKPIPTAALRSYRSLSEWIELNRRAPSCKAWLEAKAQRIAQIEQAGADEPSATIPIRSPLEMAEAEYRRVFAETLNEGKHPKWAKKKAISAAKKILAALGRDDNAVHLFTLPEIAAV